MTLNIASYNNGSSKVSSIRKQEDIDNLIIKKIASLTINDSKIWTSPKYDRSKNVHRFFQYPAMMVPIVQQTLIESITTVDNSVTTILDPFMGSATSIVAGMMNGLSCYGQDINPLSILLSKVKTHYFDIEEVSKRSIELIKSINSDERLCIEKNFRGIDKWFKVSVSLELSKIVRGIRKCEDIEIRRLFWITLAETVRLSSNDRTSTFKLHIRPLEEIQNRNISANELFEKLLNRNIDDIVSHNKMLLSKMLVGKNGYKKKISILFKNSTEYIFIPNGGIDLLVSSPPYGDNSTTVPYGQHAYLPLQWIDLKDIDESITEDLLSTISAIDRKSLGGKLILPSQEIVDNLFEISPSLRNVIEKLTVTHPDKTSKIICFTNDLYIVLQKCCEAVRKNGYLVWTIGNRRVGGIEIPNNRILIELLEHNGIKLLTEIKRDILNKRMAQRNRSTTTMVTEDILIFRKTF
ncbi:hypothetical protein VB776_14815 [Arcicella sp. DC2W]|uniref:Site-specific DNA-methyltransferase (cytosine-N(4)-specific) n=1 Tax=Arcicella gelida TaxID=2984195 RepID=A0ABU5S6V4_9BACT|nr:hypothetical protein [Arcicella sp. DC2W]MEA5404200.1 hypothetical protein [Arcicella sp. DC2W]